MRTRRVTNVLFTVACCLAGQSGWAQRTAVAPLAPLAPAEARPASPNTLLQGVQMGRQPARSALAPTTAAPAERRAWPVFLLNSRIIVNGLGKITPADIADIHVYKGADAPRQWQSLLENGLLDVTLKPGIKLKLKTKSLAAIRRQLKVSGPVTFKLNGLQIEDVSLRVATTAIAELSVLPAANEAFINIRLAPPTFSPPLQPGIYIRGVTSR